MCAVNDDQDITVLLFFLLYLCKNHFYFFFLGMIPHKTTRGQQALRRMKAYEDIPARYTSQKTMVVPLAMRMLSLQRGRKYCDVGRLSHEVGWKYQHVVKDYEARRLEREAKRAQRLKIRHVSSLRIIMHNIIN